MTAEEYLALFYPYLSNASDPRYVSPEDKAKFMAAAASKRPACLEEEFQNEAQAHYAAYLMLRTTAQTGAASTGGATPSGAIVRERQGNVEVQYAQAGQGASDATGPASPYASWYALWSLCGKGAIIASDAFCGSGGAPP